MVEIILGMVVIAVCILLMSIGLLNNKPLKKGCQPICPVCGDNICLKKDI